MSIIFRSFSDSVGTSVVPAPPSIVNGDILICTLSHDGGALSPTPPAGWNLINTRTSGAASLDQYSWWKTADNESGSYDFQGASSNVSGGISVFGSTSSAALAVVDDSISEAATVITTTSPVAVLIGDMLTCIYSNDGAPSVASSPAGMSDSFSNIIGSCSSYSYYEQIAADDPTATRSVQWSTIDDVIMSSVVIRESIPAGPTLTGPDSTTDGTNTVETGTLLDTVTTQSLVSGAYEVIQSIGVQTPTTLEYIANSGVNDCVPGTPVSGVPLEPTITAPGITPYVVQQKVDDGVNPPTTRNITINAPATHDVVQTMIATANTIDDQSIFGTSWIGVEDNMQATPPKQVDGVNFTWNADGTFTTDQDKTVNVRVPYFAPSTGQYGCINFTIQGSSIKPTGVNKNKRQSLTYQFYYNKNWRDKFQGGVN